MKTDTEIAVEPSGAEPQNRLLWVVLITAGIALAYLPVLTGLFRVWSNSDDYSHGFIILPLFFFILWKKREELAAVEVRPSLWGFGIAFLGIAAYLFSRQTGITTLASLSLLPVAAGVIVFIYGWAMLRICGFPLFLLLFMIPVPAQIYSSMTIPLQFVVTKSSAWLATSAGVPLLRLGNVIQLPEATFEVVQACSGMRSLMTMTALGAIVGYFTLNSNLFRFLLMFFALPIAILVNIFRVFSMIVADYHFGINLVDGPIHEAFGLFIYALALVLFFLSKGVLGRWDRSAS